MRRTMLVILVLAGVIIVDVVSSFGLGKQTGVFETGMAAIAAILVVIALFGLRQTYSKRTLQKMREVSELQDDERERIAVSNARTVLELLVAALVLELLIASEYWSVEQLQPFLFGIAGGTFLFVLVFLIILLRPKTWSKTRTK